MPPAVFLPVFVAFAAFSGAAFGSGCVNFNAHKLCGTFNDSAADEVGQFGCACAGAAAAVPADLSFSYALDQYFTSTTTPAPLFFIVNASASNGAAARYTATVDGAGVGLGQALQGPPAATAVNSSVVMFQPQAFGGRLHVGFTYDTAQGKAGSAASFEGAAVSCEAALGGSSYTFNEDSVSVTQSFLTPHRAYQYSGFELLRRYQGDADWTSLGTFSGEYTPEVHERFNLTCKRVQFGFRTFLNVPGLPNTMCPGMVASPLRNLSYVPGRPTQASGKTLNKTHALVSWTGGFRGGCGPVTFSVSMTPLPPSSSTFTSASLVVDDAAPGKTYSLVVPLAGCGANYIGDLRASNIHGTSMVVYAEFKGVPSCRDDGHALTDGQKAGIAVGSVVGVAVIVAGVLYVRRRRKAADEEHPKLLPA